MYQLSPLMTREFPPELWAAREELQGAMGRVPDDRIGSARASIAAMDDSEVKRLSDEVIRISRQSNSGTYEYVRDHVLGKGRDFKLGSRDMQGSKDVVDLVQNTPCAIGYSGHGYATPGVKALCVAKEAGAECIEATDESTKSRVYPLSRPLYMYTLGEPKDAVARYLAWIRSAAGQKLVADNGLVPIQ